MKHVVPRTGRCRQVNRLQDLLQASFDLLCFRHDEDSNSVDGMCG